jgi:hypothetical protein
MIPKVPICHGDDLGSIHFVDKTHIDRFIQLLENSGLVFIQNEHSVDIAVVDQQFGLTGNTDAWCHLAHYSDQLFSRYSDPENTVAVC